MVVESEVPIPEQRIVDAVVQAGYGACPMEKPEKRLRPPAQSPPRGAKTPRCSKCAR